MQQKYSKVRNTISLDNLNFEVISYKVDHVKTISSYFTMSNDTKMYINGIKPYLLTIKGYFPKTEGNDIVLSLEGLLNSSQDITFTLNSIEFQNVHLNRYAFKEQISSMYQECEISFMGVGSFNAISEEVTDE